ncbi:MAG: branched-chain amino acid ABC transporter permease [Ectothiorhodospiraceae bacterium]|nr:branched-chain amino acid ABC transporter permease [Ectothiorhodospiraceae bacterium]
MRNDFLDVYFSGVKGRASLVLAMLILVASVPFSPGSGLTFLVGLLMIQAVFAISFNILFGLTGLISFGQAAYFAAGAYGTAYLMQLDVGMPFLVAWVLGGLIGGVFAIAVGLVALRRASGIYFAILSLALGQLVYTVIRYSDALGRDDGMLGIDRPVLNFFLFQIDLGVGERYFYFILIATALLVAFLWWVWHGKLGRVLFAIRQDPDRVRFLGVNVQRYQQYAFVIGGTTAALAGGLMGPWAHILTPELAHWSYSALPILMSLLGGVAYFWGPVAGAIVFAWLGYITRTMPGIQELVIGGVLLVIVLALPGGIAGGAARIRQWLRRRRLTNEKEAGSNA